MDIVRQACYVCDEGLSRNEEISQNTFEILLYVLLYNMHAGADECQ